MLAIDSVDDIQVEVGDLAHLLEATNAILLELDRSAIAASQIPEIDRAMALIRIGRDKAERLSDEVGANHLKIRGAK
jgi:hypothetical protein